MESSRPGCGSLTDLPPRSTPELEALRDLDLVNGRFLPRGTGQRNSTAWEEALVGMGIGRGCAGQGLLRWEEFNLESTWRTLQQQMLQSGGFLVFVTAVNLLLLKAYKLNHFTFCAACSVAVMSYDRCAGEGAPAQEGDHPDRGDRHAAPVVRPAPPEGHQKEGPV